MAPYIAQRLAQLAFVLIGVSMVVFMAMHLLPGDVTQILLGDHATVQALARLRRQLGIDQPQSYVRAFNNAGFDVVRFARGPLTDYADSAEGWLREALPKLRARGWRMLVVGGQSRGARNSLQMLDTPGLADAVIAVSPASLDSNAIAVQAAEVYRITHAANAPTTRVAIAQFRGDAFVPTGMDDRVASLRAGLTGHVATLLMIDQPDGLSGHGAGNSINFAARFGHCLLRFVLDPNRRPRASAHCNSLGNRLGNSLGASS